MGLLSRAQEIFGKKVFREDVEFKGRIVTRHNQEVYATPVAGEPSLGTLHMLAAKSADIGGTATVATDIDVSALVPAGAKAVYLEVRPIAVSNTTGTSYCICVVYEKDVATNIQQVGTSISPAINGTTYSHFGHVSVKLNANRIFRYACLATGNGSRSAQIYVCGYYT